MRPACQSCTSSRCASATVMAASGSTRTLPQPPPAPRGSGGTQPTRNPTRRSAVRRTNVMMPVIRPCAMLTDVSRSGRRRGLDERRPLSHVLLVPTRAKPLILLVDDYLDTLELTAELLQFRGFDVVTAMDGAAALAEARAQMPDLVLLDLSLPVIDGLEVMRRLRNDPATRAMRIVAFTAHALESKIEEARAAGCDGFITKPVAPDDMVKEIERPARRAEPAEPARVVEARPRVR